MQTTMDIDDDLLAAAKELACREGTTVDRVVSRLLRLSLPGVLAGKARSTSGFVPFPAKAAVSNEQVNALRDTEGL